MDRTRNLRNPTEKEIFFAALERATPAEQAAYLDGACGGDQRLRERVQALLVNHLQQSRFMDKPAGELRPTVAAEQVPSEGPGSTIGRYKLLQQIGEGGCGVVYMAEQEEPVRRRVALKVIKLGMDTKSVIARFEAERQALALMDHPNIARVFDAGATDTGRPYFVMELVRGIRITDYCDQNNLPTRERLDLFTKVCQAIQHAHQKGVIHRDIKPSNILVTLHDGVPVPKVIDFGIAKATEGRLTDQTLFTAFEQFVGTPAYMSPEQAEMSGLDIDTRSDIYSLGVLLYELLTGKTPFDAKELLAAGLDEMRRTIREKEPARPSTRLSTMLNGELTATARHRHSDPPRLVHLIRGDLDWIVMKALEKDRTHRYETATGLARDIQRHLGNEPVVARPPSTLYRAQKFIRRNKVMAAAAGLVALALVLGALVSTWQAVRATHAHREARQAEQSALHNLYIANLHLAQAGHEQGNVTRVRQLLEETRSHPSRGFEWYYWQRELHRDLTTLRGHLEPVRGVAISPDGKLAATASNDRTAKLWDAAGHELRTFEFQKDCRAVAFSPDGARLAIGGDQRAIIWDVAHRQELLVITNNYQANVWQVAFSPDGSRLAVGLANPECSVIADAASGKTLRELKEQGLGAANAIDTVTLQTSLAFSRDGRRLFTGDYAGIARIWDAETGALLRRFEGNSGCIWAGEFSPDGSRVVTAHDAAYVAKVWDVATTNIVHTLKGHQGFVMGVAFSPRGDRIYTTGLDQQIKVWDPVTGNELRSLPKSQSSGLVCMAVSRDGQHIITGSWNGEANLWAVEMSGGPRTLEVRLWPGADPGSSGRFEGFVHGPAIFLKPDSAQGLMLAASPDYAVKVFDFGSRRELLDLRGHTNCISSVAVSPDARLIATGSRDRTARIWDARSGQELFTLRGHTGVVSSVAFSPDSRQVLTTSGHALRVWDAPTGRTLRQLDLGTNVEVAAFSPDGRWIAAAARKEVTLWDTQDGHKVRTLDHPAWVLAVAWTRDSQRLVTGGWDWIARMWEVSSGRPLRDFKGHRQWIWALSFSPDERRLLTGSQDHTARLWEVATGRELLTLKGHGDAVTSAFFADERRIITGSDDQTAKVWEAASPEEVAAWERDEKAAEENLERIRRDRERAKAPAINTRSAENK